MRIGVDIQSLTTQPRTGVGEYTFELLDMLFQIDQTNEYVLFANSAKDVSHILPRWTAPNIQTVYRRFPNKLLHLSILAFKQPKIDTLIPDVDIFFSPNIAFTALSRGMKQILTVHDLSFELMPETFSRKRRWWHHILTPEKQCERADIILVPSNNTKRDLMQIYGVSGEKIHVLYPGIGLQYGQVDEQKKQAAANKYGLPKKFILFLGTIEPRKNIDALLDAVEYIGPQAPELVIAGAHGWLCKKTLSRIAHMKKVRFIGYVDPEDKPAIYALADIFVYPSLYEGFGFPPLEAMACGTPVITSNRSSLPEITGDAAMLVSPYHVAEIAEAIQTLLHNPELARRYTEKGKQRAASYSWQKAAETFLSLL